MKKKGFTLIELLAVIVILAIIALIATPIILSMINNARKSAAKSSAYGYIEAIDSNNGFADAEVEGYTKIADGTYQTSEINVLIKGKAPDSGTIKIENGKVSEANICINGYTVTYEKGKEAQTGSKCGGSSSSSSEEPQSTFGGELSLETSGSTKTYKGIVYLNPTDLTATCTSSTAVSITGTNTGCMKFYIYDDSNNQYKMILDHNTSGNVAWNSSGNKADGMNEVATRLSEDTTGWVGSPRLITANEVAHITGADSNDTIKWAQSKTFGTSDTSTQASWFYLDGGSNSNPTVYASGSNGWQKRVAKSTTPSNYAWLFDYTNGCDAYGCTTKDDNKYPYGTKDSTNTAYINGYWTSDAVVNNSDQAWKVTKSGILSIDDVDFGSYQGVRPVITISKASLN